MSAKKTPQQRRREVDEIRTQIERLGIPIEREPEFVAAARRFEEDGASGSGKIRLRGFKRVLEYTFSMQPHVDSRAVLKFDAHV